MSTTSSCLMLEIEPAGGCKQGPLRIVQAAMQLTARWASALPVVTSTAGCRARRMHPCPSMPVKA